MVENQALAGGLALDFVEQFYAGYRASGLDSVPTLGEREWLEALLEFANNDPQANLVKLLTCTEAGPVAVLDEVGIAEPEEQITAVQALDRMLPGVRETFFELLTVLVEKGSAEAKRIRAVQLLGDPSGRVSTVHRFQRVGKELRRVGHLMPENIRTAFAFGMFLLLSSDREFGNKLCRCQLESCRRFFLEYVSRGANKPSRTYCKPEHLKEYHRLDTARRVRKTRARKAK